MCMKTNKSILKRIRVTKSGKLIRRKAGQNHFNAKESRKVQRRKRELWLVRGKTARLLKSRI